MIKYQHVFHYDCVDELNSGPHGWDLDISALHSGPEHARLCGSASHNVLINTVKMGSGTLQKGSVPAGMCTFSIIIEQSGAHCSRGHDLNRNVLTTIPQDRELHALSADGISILTLSITLDALAHAAEKLQLAPRALGKLPEAMALSDLERGKLFTRLEAFAELLVSGFQNGQAPMRIQQQEEELITSFLADITGASQTGQKVPFDKRYRATRSALDYIHNHPREAVTVATLATEAGASRRTLETGFRDMLDMSPKQFINTSRLRGCREELALQRGEPRGMVNETAQSWGFFHLGQFAADYRKLFGELPSQTLK